jgi:hypothetical protein
MPLGIEMSELDESGRITRFRGLSDQ